MQQKRNRPAWRIIEYGVIQHGHRVPQLNYNVTMSVAENGDPSLMQRVRHQSHRQFAGVEDQGDSGEKQTIVEKDAQE